jgi:EthD domain
VAEKKYYKILLFMKRRPGMTLEAFKDYYENHHVPLAMKYDSGTIKRYFRRFITAQPNPDTGATGELQFDVISELWFEDEAAYLGTVNHLSTSIMPDDVVEDEKKLFDRPTMRIATVVECETEMTR